MPSGTIVSQTLHRTPPGVLGLGLGRKGES